MKIGAWIAELGKDPLPGMRESDLSGRPYATVAMIFCLAAIIIVPLLQAFRGLDLTDTGFVATNQRLIFSDPARVAYWFHLWLTNILGGVVDLIFGRWGLLPMKLAAAVIFWGTAAAAFKLFKSALPRELVWVGVTVSIVFGFADKINIIHYNNLSALFMALGAWLITDGCISKRRVLLFAAGFTLGLSVLVRVPNALGLGLIFIPLILDAVTGGRSGRLRADSRGVLLYIAGAIAALLIGFSVMASLGHLPLYLASLRDLGASTGTEGSQYRSSMLFLRPARDGVLAVVLGTLSLAFITVLAAVIGLLKSRIMRTGLLMLAGILLCVAFFRGFPGDPVSYTAFRAIAGLGYLAALAAALFLVAPGDERLRAGSAMAAAVVIVLTVGSDTAIKVSTYAFPLLVPGILGVLSRISRVKLPPSERGLTSLSALVVVIVLGALSVFGLARSIYRDTFRMTRTVNHPMLAGIFTSPARAQALEEALPVISSFAPPGSDLLAYDSLGLIHFATCTRPYLDNPWPSLYPSSELEWQGPLPVVVLAAHNPRSAAWPMNSQPPVRVDIVRAFLERHGYTLKWQNDALAVYLPADTKP
jgi:hypothetical protein